MGHTPTEAQPATDCRSAYFGHLPVDCDRNEVATMASACGEIVDLVYYRKTVPGGIGK